MEGEAPVISPRGKRVLAERGERREGRGSKMEQDGFKDGREGERSCLRPCDYNVLSSRLCLLPNT